MVFLFLAAVIFLLVGVFLLKLMMFQPTPKAPLKHAVQITPEGWLTIRGRLPRLGVKKQRKRRIICKSRSSRIIFKPKFEKKQWKTEPKLVYMAYISKSSTVVFFRDLYHTIERESKHVATPRRLFDTYLPKNGKNCMSPPLHCKGLFVLPTANNVSVCNPATKEVITLPQSRSMHIPRTELRENEGFFNIRVGFGFLQSTQAYKVTQFFYRSYNFEEKRYSMGLEVFTIGISRFWRVLAEDPPYPIWNTCSTFAGKCIYFYIWHPIAPYAPNAFLCFHLTNEKYSMLYPPYSLKHISVLKMTLTNLQGRLCLSALSMNNTKFNVFTTKIGTNLLGWTPRFSFSIALQPGNVTVTPIEEYRGRFLIHVNDKKNPQRLEFYNPKDGSFEEVNGESEDLKMTEEGFMLFVKKPWFYVSSYEEKAYLNLSECGI